jgi:gliding motility-associated-like protein
MEYYGHRPDEVRVGGRSGEWDSYSGWQPDDVNYRLIHGDIMFEVDGQNSYKPQTVSEFAGCYRLLAQNLSNPDWKSFSNKICISENIPLLFPNVITPNGDGKNDRFEISNLNYYPEHELRIFNRWGREVFYDSDYRNEWPQENLPAGTYFFHLRTNNAGEEHFKGWIELLR